MPRKNAIPEGEKAICHRLRVFRLLHGLSQAEFASLAGLDPRVYASYEYERSQLNYVAGWRILSAFRVLNPHWLAEGQGLVFDLHFDNYPTPAETKMGPRAPFSAVYRRMIKDRFKSGLWMLPQKGKLPKFTISPDDSGRAAASEALNVMVIDWLASQPNSQLTGFVNALIRSGAELLRRFPPEKGKTDRLTRLLRLQSKKHVPLLESEKNNLTDSSENRKSADMSELSRLLARIKQLTKERGAKARLAEFLKVPQSRVSEWLSGINEPGGETTLRLLHWVEQQGRPKT